MTPDQLHDLRESIIKGLKHNEPSSDTIKAITEQRENNIIMQSQLNTISDKIGDLVERAKEANHKTSKHSEWINKNDKAVLSIPSIQTKVFIFTGVLIGINVVGFIAFWNMLKNLI